MIARPIRGCIGNEPLLPTAVTMMRTPTERLLMKRFATAITVAFVVLTACADDGAKTSKEPGEQSAKTTEAPQGGPGTYEWEYYTAKGTITVPESNDKVLASDKDAQALEDYRKLTKNPEVFYVTVDVNNQESTTENGELINPQSLVIISDSGQTLTGISGADLASQWMETVGGNSDAEVSKYNVGVDLSNELADRADTRPGAVGSYVFGFEEPFTDVASVHITPSEVGEEVEAKKTS
jgi:hypothetical protein